jgi:hypothetical protein
MFQKSCSGVAVCHVLVDVRRRTPWPSNSATAGLIAGLPISNSGRRGMQISVGLISDDAVRPTFGDTVCELSDRGAVLVELGGGSQLNVDMESPVYMEDMDGVGGINEFA